MQEIGAFATRAPVWHAFAHKTRDYRLARQPRERTRLERARCVHLINSTAYTPHARSNTIIAMHL